jgi:hypothetical protein
MRVTSFESYAVPKATLATLFIDEVRAKVGPIRRRGGTPK